MTYRFHVKIVTLITCTFVLACAIHCGKGGESNPAAPIENSKNGNSDGVPHAVDGNRALSIVADIVAFGPRHAGTQGAEKTRRYIIESLERYGLKPTRHDFVALTPHPELKTVPFANIVANIDGPGEKKVLIGGHFDGKILKNINFQGANDGGSSTALLLELARFFSHTPPPCPVSIVFFDGEEALVDWSDSDSLYGSKKMAAELKQSGEDKLFQAVVIVDMIGDGRLRLTREGLSTPWVFEVLEKTAKRLGHGDIFKGPRGNIEDDHLPFLHIGIPAAVLIDLKFGPGWNSNAYWHTEEDTIDKLSAKSFEIVGQVVLESLPDLINRSR